MASKHKYVMTRKCSECGKKASCLYTPSGAFRGVWRCADCERKHSFSDDIADAAKAAEQLTRKQDKPCP